MSLYDRSGASLGTVTAIDGVAKMAMPKDLAYARTYVDEPLAAAHVDPVTGGTYHKIKHGASTTIPMMKGDARETALRVS